MHVCIGVLTKQDNKEENWKKEVFKEKGNKIRVVKYYSKPYIYCV